jgi:large subunit ribosomal protein L31
MPGLSPAFYLMEQLKTEGGLMKRAIHPESRIATVTCASCGSELVTRWSAGDMTIETCSQCHPAYTGKAAKVSAGSRIERFERRFDLGRDRSI